MADLTQGTDPPPPVRDRQRDREMAELYRNTLTRFLAKLLPPEPSRSIVDRLLEDWVAALAVDLDAIITGVCPEDPTKLTGAPIGQYHCPACGCMVLAGIAHHPHDDGCRLGLNEPDIDNLTTVVGDSAAAWSEPLHGDGQGEALPPLRPSHPGGVEREA